MGLWIRRKEEPVFIIFFSLWMILLITWPYWQGTRFIFPLLPILIYFTFQGMKTAINKLPEKYQQLDGDIPCSVLIAGIFLFSSYRASTICKVGVANGPSIISRKYIPT
jgi:hypothetical protein